MTDSQTYLSIHSVRRSRMSNLSTITLDFVLLIDYKRFIIIDFYEIMLLLNIINFYLLLWNILNTLF